MRISAPPIRHPATTGRHATARDDRARRPMRGRLLCRSRLARVPSLEASRGIECTRYKHCGACFSLYPRAKHGPRRPDAFEVRSRGRRITATGFRPPNAAVTFAGASPHDVARKPSSAPIYRHVVGVMLERHRGRRSRSPPHSRFAMCSRRASTNSASIDRSASSAFAAPRLEAVAERPRAGRAPRQPVPAASPDPFGELGPGASARTLGRLDLSYTATAARAIAGSRSRAAVASRWSGVRVRCAPSSRTCRGHP